MSVAELAAELRRIAAALPTDALHQATALLDEAHTILATLTTGSRSPDLPDAIQRFTEAIENLKQVHHTTTEVEQTITRYLAHIGATTQPPPTTTPIQPRATPPPSSPDQNLIAEVQRLGHKISPDRVIHIGKDQTGKVIWLEKGDQESGFDHMMDRDRVRQFADQDIAREDIATVAFRAATTGRPMGITGANRIVYATVYNGRNVLIAVTVGSNGYIVGANPFTANTKMKPLP